MSDSRIRYELDNHVACITIDRPDALNAMTTDMLKAFRVHLETAENDADVRVVVITGTRPGFCAGYDINEFRSTKDLKGIWDTGMLMTSTWSYVRKMSKATIAAIGGPAAGGGFELSLCCDIRIAARSAKLGSCEVNLHQPTTNGSSQLLARLIGESKAKELVLTGNVWPADQAERFGLINHVAEDAEFDKTVAAWAERIASRSPVAVSLAKGFFESLRLLPADVASAIEEEAAIKCYLMDDMQEAFSSFLEKRKPVWTGR